MLGIYERFRAAVGLGSQSLASTNATGSYIRAGKRNFFHVITGAMANAATVKAEIYEATDGRGTSAQAIAAATCTITATTNATKVNVVVNAVTNGKTIIVNGITYTAAGAYSLANKEFTQASELDTLINYYSGDTLYAADDGGTNVVIEAKNPSETAITIGGTLEAVKLVPSVLEAQAYIEVDAGMMDLADDMTHLAIKLTTVGTVVVSCGVLIDDYTLPFPVKQAVGASDTLVI